MLYYKPLQVKTVSRFADFGSHLGAKSFFAMLAVAAFLHASIIGIIAMMPHNPVVKIPVRVLNLNFGTGNSEQVIPKEQPVQQDAHNEADKPVIDDAPEEAQSTPQEELEKVLSSKQNEPKTPPKPAAIAVPVAKKAAVMPAKEKTPAAVAVIDRVIVSKAQALNVPKQYVRGASPLEITQPKPADANAGPAEIVQKYEQAISVWTKRFKTYPEEAKRRGVEGVAEVRIHINRQGKVLYYVIEKSSGDAFIDQAAMSMVRAADPFPAVPDNYPQGEELAFKIPVIFTLKQ